MKIQINDKESYEIIIPENVTAQEYMILTDRLHIITKLLNKDPFLNAIDSKDTNFTKTKRSRGKKYSHLWKDRDIVVELIKACYNPNKEEAQKVYEKYKVEKANIQNSMYYLLTKFSISDSEIGRNRKKN